MKKFEDINQYIQLSRETRRSHLDLSEECITIGGFSSVCYKGLLAHFLNTTIPHGTKVYLCHACNNHGCSNPRHLYWGTPADNVQDQKESGTFKNFHEKLLNKYGPEKTREIHQHAARKGGKKGGGHNALGDDQLHAWDEVLNSVDLMKLGWVSEVSEKMGCSHAHVKRIVGKYFSNKKRYIRKSPHSGTIV